MSGPPPGRQLAPLATEADREKALRTLRAAHAAGRLGEEEFERRVGKALTARTRAEVRATQLGYLTVDLPARGGRLGRRVHRAALGLHAAAFTGANGTAIGVWALTGEGLFWPALLLVPTSGLLAAHAASGPLVRRAWRTVRGRSDPPRRR
ncbi:MAG: DUF1707 domain-containing protein [Solirubrobacterales bacterium]|nr:DUF1707 domain-containing protein [Solirubrobacterales bacterium]